jgi:hypothetical protein
METTEIKCDQCGEDITYTGNSVDYRLILGFQSKDPWYLKEGLRGGAVTDMMISPPLNRAYHFCGTSCLAVWAQKNYPQAAEQYERILLANSFQCCEAVVSSARCSRFAAGIADMRAEKMSALLSSPTVSEQFLRQTNPPSCLSNC